MKKTLKRINWSEHGILFALIILWVILMSTNRNFRNLDIFMSILREASFSGICGIGMTYCIASKHFDMSVASMMAFMSGSLTMMLVSFTKTIGFFGIIAAIVISMAIAVVCGLFNGLLVAKMRIPAFITTLGTLYVFRSFAFIVSNEDSVALSRLMDRDLSITFRYLGYGDLAGIPIPFWVMVICGIIGTVMLRKTKLCRDILAIGNSIQASRISGINIDRTKIYVFVLVGLFTGIAGVLNTAFLGSSNPGMYTGFEFTVISVVVLGGTALAGGKGSIFNTIVAAIFIVTVIAGMNTYGINTFTQRVVQGVILLFAFSVTTIRNIIENGIIRRKAARSVAASVYNK